jgi:hypothetical protein
MERLSYSDGFTGGWECDEKRNTECDDEVEMGEVRKVKSEGRILHNRRDIKVIRAQLQTENLESIDRK